MYMYNTLLEFNSRKLSPFFFAEGFRCFLKTLKFWKNNKIHQVSSSNYVVRRHTDQTGALLLLLLWFLTFWGARLPSETLMELCCCSVAQSCPALCDPMDCIACWASLPFTISLSLLKLVSIDETYVHSEWTHTNMYTISRTSWTSWSLSQWPHVNVHLVLYCSIQ